MHVSGKGDDVSGKHSKVPNYIARELVVLFTKVGTQKKDRLRDGREGRLSFVRICCV